MNKISKKIVALVTMAAFVLTLVPAAAFAANGEVSVNASKISVNGSTEIEVVANDDTETISFSVNDATGVGTNKPLGSAQDVKLWVTDSAGNYAADAVTFSNNVQSCDVNNKMSRLMK